MYSLDGRADSLEKTEVERLESRSEKGETEDKIVGWYHQHDGNESEQTQKIVKDRKPDVYGPWVRKELT